MMRPGTDHLAPHRGHRPCVQPAAARTGSIRLARVSASVSSSKRKGQLAPINAVRPSNLVRLKMAQDPIQSHDYLKLVRAERIVARLQFFRVLMTGQIPHLALVSRGIHNGEWIAKSRPLPWNVPPGPQFWILLL